MSRMLIVSTSGTSFIKRNCSYYKKDHSCSKKKGVTRFGNGHKMGEIVSYRIEEGIFWIR